MTVKEETGTRNRNLDNDSLCHTWITCDQTGQVRKLCVNPPAPPIRVSFVNPCKAIGCSPCAVCEDLIPEGCSIHQHHS